MTEPSGSTLSLPADHPVHAVAQACRREGGRALVVGGWVRDRVRAELPRGSGRESPLAPGPSGSVGSAGSSGSNDIDLEIFGLVPEAVENLLAGFGRVHRVGRSFPVFLLAATGQASELAPIEVALPRRPESSSSHTPGDDVWHSFDPELGFEEASCGRDLRVNAMAWDPLTGALLDPHGGREDLRAGRLRATSARTFGADPLRGLRTAQLAARLGLRPDDELRALCAATDLGSVAGERIFAELEKLLLLAPQPSRGFELLRETQLLRFLPEMAALVGVPQDPLWHPEGDVFVHTLMVIDRAAQMRVGVRERDLALMFGALCHDFGKPLVTEERDGRIVSRSHSEVGVGPTEALLERLRAPGQLLRTVGVLVRDHLAPAQFTRSVGLPGKQEAAGPRGYKRLARRLRAAGADIDLLYAVARADHLGRTTEEALRGEFPAGELFLQRARDFEAKESTHVDVVRGQDVLARGLVPGPEVGRVLARCRQIQDDTGWDDAERILDRAFSGSG